MSVKIREQRGKLYLDVYQNGVRKWESLHITLSDDKKQNKERFRQGGIVPMGSEEGCGAL